MRLITSFSQIDKSKDAVEAIIFLVNIASYAVNFAFIETRSSSSSCVVVLYYKHDAEMTV